MRRCWVFFYLLIMLGSGASPVLAQLPTNPFRIVQSAPSAIEAQPGERIQLHADILMPSGHYLYREQTFMHFGSVQTLPLTIVQEPSFHEQVDPFMGKTVEIYDGKVRFVAEATIPSDVEPGPYDVIATMEYQGCSPTICFRRMTASLVWVVTVPGRETRGTQDDGRTDERSSQSSIVPASEASGRPSSFMQLITNPSFDTLLAHGKPLTFALTFVGGILTSFTPCVLPMIPVILLIIGIEPGARRRNLWLSTCLAAGVALTSAAAGAVAALVGIPMAFLFQQRWFVVVVVAIFTLMALSMFGLFTIQLPAGLQARLHTLGGRGPKGAFLAGVSTGVLATPCAGPVIAALVTYVGTSGDLVFGSLLLLTYGLGFGVLFLFVGTFYGQLAQRLPRGRSVRLAKYVLGILLLFPAGYYTWVVTAPTDTWESNELVAFAEAREFARPVLVEFTAKSCPPCLVMEQTTFQDPAVLEAFATRVVPLRVDMTFPTEEKLALADRYRVVGWPALIFVAPDGTVLWDLSLVGKVVSVEELLSHISQAEGRMP